MRGCQCKHCVNYINDWCKKKTDSPDPNLIRDCEYFKQLTNADRIRAMTDEELAKFLDDVQACNVLCKPFIYEKCNGCKDYACWPCWLEWLKQEA